MQQHSEAYIHVMESLRRRKIRKRVLQVVLALGIGSGVLGMLNLQGYQAAQAMEDTIVVTTKQPLVTGGVATVFTKITELPEEYTEPEVEPFSEEEAYLLAKIAMAEAEGEDTIGKALVIRTVLNRVESAKAYFPDTIAEVIFQKKAFTPTQNGRFTAVEPNEDCYAALELIKEGWDDSQGALYFERNTTKATWHSRNLKKLFVHGNHTFYAEVAK